MKQKPFPGRSLSASAEIAELRFRMAKMWEQREVLEDKRDIEVARLRAVLELVAAEPDVPSDLRERARAALAPKED